MGNMCLKLLTIQSGFALFVAGFATAVCAGIIKDGFQLVPFIEGCVILLFISLICSLSCVYVTFE